MPASPFDKPHKPKLALIPPFELLEYTDQTSVQLMLPHLTVNPVYEYTYQQHCKDENQYVILDNGEAEGIHYPTYALIDMALSFGVNELVIPDVIKDSSSTIKKANEFLLELNKRLEDDPKVGNLSLMFVAQGSNAFEFLQSIAWAAKQNEIHTIGIPRHALETCNDVSIRANLADFAMMEAPGKQMHLLGTAPWSITELRDYTWSDNVRSVDTSAPFNYAYANRKIRLGSKVPRPKYYFDLPFESFSQDKLDYNVHWLQEHTA